MLAMEEVLPQESRRGDHGDFMTSNGYSSAIMIVTGVSYVGNRF